MQWSVIQQIKAYIPIQMGGYTLKGTKQRWTDNVFEVTSSAVNSGLNTPREVENALVVVILPQPSELLCCIDHTSSLTHEFEGTK